MNDNQSTISNDSGLELNSLVPSGTIYVNKSKFNLSSRVNYINTKETTEKIHYNPKFIAKCNNATFNKAASSLCFNNVKTAIHINPSFQRIRFNAVSTPESFSDPYSNICSESNLINKQAVQQRCMETRSELRRKESVHVNPRFVTALSHSSLNTIGSKCKPLASPQKRNIVVSSVHSISCDSLSENYSEFGSDVSTKFIGKSSPNISQFRSKYCIRRNLKPKDKTVKYDAIHPEYSVALKLGGSKLIRKFNENKENKSYTRKSEVYFNSPKKRFVKKYFGRHKKYIKYFTVTKRNRFKYSGRKMVKASFGQVSRNNILLNGRVFKQIGKRKLIRRSLIEGKNVSQGTHSVSNSSKVVNEHNTSYKVLSGPNESFIKIGRRKIIRKSVLQSVISARRNAQYRHLLNSKKMWCYTTTSKKINNYSYKSRFKVVRKLEEQTKDTPKKEFRTRRTSNRLWRKSSANHYNSKSYLYRINPILRLRNKFVKLNKKRVLRKKNKCLYYNRFGYCNGKNNGKCKKWHDPKYIAICPRFLKGTCDGKDCKLSHDTIPEKMPTCHQYLAGVCIREKCPFLHVKISLKSPICLDFLQGFCSNGENCTRRHQFICPKWDAEGSCDKGNKCIYPHPKLKEKNTTTVPKKRKEANTCRNVEKTGHLSSSSRYFISSDSSTDENKIASKLNPDSEEGKKSIYEDNKLLSFIPFT